MEAHFVKACVKPTDFPPQSLPEVAVAGRSNCGKSSLINALTAHQQLARTSSTPGRTQQIIFFHLILPGKKALHLVDLPGYGYARAGKAVRRTWADLIPHYLESRPQLQLLLLLMDARRPPAAEEHQLIQWMAQRRTPLGVILTKADKLKKSQRPLTLAATQRELGLESRPLAFSTHEPPTIVALRDEITAQLFGETR